MLLLSIRTIARLAAVAAVAASLACDSGRRAPPAGGIVLTDLSGRTVALDRPARRVVSMMPAVTEWVIAMGAADRLIARTDFDTQPELDTLPSVGGGLTPSLEWLAAREPDLVVAWPDATSRSVVARLEDLGVTVYTASAQTIDESLTVAHDVGRLLGLAAAADSVAESVRRGLDSVRASVADMARPSVLYLIGTDPLMAAGPGTFVNELIAVAGGRNVLADLEVLWPQVALEEVVLRDPDVIVLGSVAAARALERLRRRPGWRDLSAIRGGRVHAVDPDLVNRPGPRLDQAAARLARAIHATGR